MPITLTSISHDQICQGYSWVVNDIDKLAGCVATVALGNARHIQRVLLGTGISTPSTTDAAKISAIKMLTVIPGTDPWHRDGWVFQIMSWIAAHKAYPTSKIQLPQMILAHKGFDGLLLEIDNNTNKVSTAIIFEDKATNNQRSIIRNDVWSEFENFESGENEHVLIADATAILSTSSTIDVDAAIENIFWKDIKKYRVSISIGATHNHSLARRKNLFKGYNTVVKGGVDRRLADTIYINDLRPWMHSLAEKSIEIIKQR